MRLPGIITWPRRSGAPDSDTNSEIDVMSAPPHFIDFFVCLHARLPLRLKAHPGQLHEYVLSSQRTVQYFVWPLELIGSLIFNGSQTRPSGLYFLPFLKLASANVLFLHHKNNFFTGTPSGWKSDRAMNSVGTSFGWTLIIGTSAKNLRKQALQ